MPNPVIGCPHGGLSQVVRPLQSSGAREPQHWHHGQKVAHLAGSRSDQRLLCGWHAARTERPPRCTAGPSARQSADARAPSCGGLPQPHTSTLFGGSSALRD
eukprot:6202289-Pleurochrysis_carterae.AAC.2